MLLSQSFKRSSQKILKNSLIKPCVIIRNKHVAINHSLEKTNIIYDEPAKILNKKEHKDHIPQPIVKMVAKKTIEPKKYAIENIEDPQLIPLKLASNIYATFSIYGRPFTVQKGDTVVIPSKLKGLKVGDEINFHDVEAIGSTNYKIIDHPINPIVFSLKGRVVEMSKSKEKVFVKTVVRNRKDTHLKKHTDLTIIEITELKLN